MDSETRSAEQRIRKKRINPRWRRRRTRRFALIVALVALAGCLALALSGYRWWLERNLSLRIGGLDRPDLELAALKIDRTGKKWLLAGEVRNRSPRAYRDVEASFHLVGRGGNAFDTAVVRTPRIRAGETWTFGAEVKEGLVTAVRLRELTGIPE